MADKPIIFDTLLEEDNSQQKMDFADLDLDKLLNAEVSDPLLEDEDTWTDAPAMEDDTGPIEQTPLRWPGLIDINKIDNPNPTVVDVLITDTARDESEAFWLLRDWYSTDFVKSAEYYLQTGSLDEYHYLDSNVKAIKEYVDNIKQESNASDEPKRLFEELGKTIDKAWLEVRNAKK